MELLVALVAEAGMLMGLTQGVGEVVIPAGGEANGIMVLLPLAQAIQMDVTVGVEEVPTT